MHHVDGPIAAQLTVLRAFGRSFSRPRILTRRNFAMEIFGREEQAVDWLHEHHERRTATRIERDQLLRVLRDLALAL